MEDRFITAREYERFSNPEENINQIIQDLKNGTLRIIEGGYYSRL